MANVVALTAPTPSINAIDTGVMGEVVLSLSPRISASVPPNPQSVSLTTPTPLLAVAGVVGVVGAVQLAMPMPVFQMGAPVVLLAMPTPRLRVSGIEGIIGDVVLGMPMPVLLTTAPDTVALQLPVPRVVVAGATGVTGAVSLTSVLPTISALARVPFVAGVQLAMPLPVIQSFGTVGIIGTMANTLRTAALAVSGTTGVIGTAVMALPVVDLAIAGYQPVIGTVSLRLPVMIVQASGSAGKGSQYFTVAMQTENQAVTMYDNYPFNSFAKFNGVYIGASDGGIFALTGDTDATAKIKARARWGITDFGTAHQKRVDRCYVGYRADGNMVLRVMTDEIHVRDYLLTATGAPGLHGNHVRIGKGLTARYWQFEIQNQEGSDFDLNIVELKPTVLRRRIGGGDA